MNKKQLKEARKAMKAWGYKEKMADIDIEGAVDGPLLRGPDTMTLYSLANRARRDHGLSRGPDVHREFEDIADEDDIDLVFSRGTKARYYHHAELLSAQALREGVMSHDECFTWALHAQGEGERVIADLLDLPRSRVRKYIRLLYKNIELRLDKENGVC